MHFYQYKHDLAFQRNIPLVLNSLNVPSERKKSRSALGRRDSDCKMEAVFGTMFICIYYSVAVTITRSCYCAFIILAVLWQH